MENKKVHGNFQKGKFYPYGGKGEFKDATIKTDDKKLLKRAKDGKIIHGEFRNGEFIPNKNRVIKDARNFSKFDSLKVDYLGRLFEGKKLVGGILPGGDITTSFLMEKIVSGDLSE